MCAIGTGDCLGVLNDFMILDTRKKNLFTAKSEANWFHRTKGLKTCTTKRHTHFASSSTQNQFSSMKLTIEVFINCYEGDFYFDGEEEKLIDPFAFDLTNDLSEKRGLINSRERGKWIYSFRFRLNFEFSTFLSSSTF